MIKAFKWQNVTIFSWISTCIYFELVQCSQTQIQFLKLSWFRLGQVRLGSKRSKSYVTKLNWINPNQPNFSVRLGPASWSKNGFNWPNYFEPINANPTSNGGTYKSVRNLTKVTSWFINKTSPFHWTFKERCRCLSKIGFNCPNYFEPIISNLVHIG